MKIKKHTGILVAEKVIKEMRKLEGSESYIATYANGRENGFHVINFKYSARVTIAENRNSDNIVVYFTNNRFGITNDGICDVEYKNRKMFDFGEYKEAAEFCAKKLHQKSK